MVPTLRTEELMATALPKCSLATSDGMSACPAGELKARAEPSRTSTA